jgi:TrmH family RNA methyltransferase
VCYFACAEHFAKSHDLNEYKNRAPCEVFRDSLFESLAETVTPPGILAVCQQQSFSCRGLITPGGLYLMGEMLSDPGNVGALIRTAAAAGADGVFLGKGSAELYNPKVLRAAAGAALRIPVATGVDISEAVVWLKEAGVCLYAADPRGDSLPYDIDFLKGGCLLVGHETQGVSETMLALADARLRLPMQDGASESLNASVAGSILLYEAVRQRFVKKGAFFEK